MAFDRKRRSTWQTLIRRCLQRRVDPTLFIKYAQLVQKECPARGTEVCEVLLRGPQVLGIDPLIPLYVDHLLALGIVHTHQLLQILLQDRQKGQVSDLSDESVSRAARLILRSCSVEQAVLATLAKAYTTSSRASQSETRATLGCLTAWMLEISQQSTSVVVQSASASSADVARAVLSVREHLATLAVTILSNGTVVDEINGKDVDKDTVCRLAEALASFINVVTQDFMPLATRLQMIQRENSGLNPSRTPRHDKQAIETLVELDVNTVIDNEALTSRGGFMIYLDAMLDGCPTITDSAVLGYLHLRYKDNATMAASDMIIASFDVLTSAAIRRETAERMFVTRSFLVNKVPLLLGMAAATSFVPLEYEMIIAQAFNRLDPNTFRSLPDGLELDGQNHNSLSEVRTEFLSSCALHGILADDSVERILGNNHMQTLSKRTREDRQALVAECKQDSQKLEKLIEGTEAMDGNVVARVDALLDIFQVTCNARDKATLKTLSNKISKRTTCLDALALFINLSSFLRPLCRMLVEWKHDEDQGEHQPVYDEFSACLLLVLAMKHRFNLTVSELGLDEEESIVRKLLDGRSGSSLQRSLKADQDKHLAGWICGLFETEGISDELMSTCSPQEFYEIVPTLFQQMTIAVKSNALDGETLKSGLGLLLETFLIPALIPGLSWIVDHDWDQPGERNIVMLILQRVMRPTSIRGEAVNMHNTILSIIGKPLWRFLGEAQQREPTRQDIDPLLERLRGCLDFCRAREATMEEFNSWTAPQGGSILRNMRAHFANLCYWSSPAAMNATTPTFTHRLFSTAISLAGAKAVMDVIVDEVKAQSAAGLADIALDVASSLLLSTMIDHRHILSTPNTANVPGRLILQEVLQIDLHDAPHVKTKDVLRSETLVRMGRRVDVLLPAVPNPAAEGAKVAMPLADDMLNMPDIGDLDAAAAMGQMDTGQGGGDQLGFNDQDADQMQLSTDATMQDVGASGAGDGTGESAEESMAPPTEDDIFGDLMLDIPFDF